MSSDIGIIPQGQPSQFQSGAFAALKIGSYRIYFGALVAQMAAMNMQMVARTWFMYELTDSAAMLGAVGLAAALPMLTISLFGGVIADRMCKKHILVAGQLASGVVSLGVAVLITVGTISWHHLFWAAFFQGVVMALMMPARQAVIHELVGENTLMNAIALNVSAMNFLRLTAPAAAGFFIALWSIEGVYYIMTVLYIIGLGFALRLPHGAAILPHKDGAIRELIAGLRYIRHNSTLMAILILALVAAILSMPYLFLLPIFTKDILVINTADLGRLATWPVLGPLFQTLTESSTRQGLLISISGCGALIGSLIIAAMPNKRRGLFFLLSLIVSAASLICFSTTNTYLLALVVFIPMGLGQAGQMALGNTLLQAYSEDAYRGRVMSVYMMIFGVTLVGVFLVSLVAEAVGVRWAIGGSAGLLFFITIVYFIFTPRIRSLE